MGFILTEEQEKFREEVRIVLSKECSREYVWEIYEKGEFPWKILKLAAERGWLGVPFPKEYGGKGGNALDWVILWEELSKRGLDILTGVLMVQPVLLFGNEEQKKYYIPKIINGEILVALAMTEPEAGSDIASLKTTALRHADGYVLNGKKTYSATAHLASYAITLARTEMDPKVPKHRGITIFMVDLKKEGITITPLRQLGRTPIHGNEISFEDVKVSEDDILGEANRGLYHILNMVEIERIVTAAMNVGVAQGAFEDALEYAKKREQFGQPIGKFQVIQHMLAEMATRIDAARLLTYRAGWLKSNGVLCPAEASMAKAYSADVCMWVVVNAMQVMAGYGFSVDRDMQRYFRDAKFGSIAGGTTQIQRNIIAQNLGL